MIVATNLAFKQTWCSQFCNQSACSGCWPGGPSRVSIVFSIWLMKHSNTLHHISSEIFPCGSNAANRILVTLMNCSITVSQPRRIHTWKRTSRSEKTRIGYALYSPVSVSHGRDTKEKRKEEKKVIVAIDHPPLCFFLILTSSIFGRRRWRFVCLRLSCTRPVSWVVQFAEGLYQTNHLRLTAHQKRSWTGSQRNL